LHETVTGRASGGRRAGGPARARAGIVGLGSAWRASTMLESHCHAGWVRLSWFWYCSGGRRGLASDRI